MQCSIYTDRYFDPDKFLALLGADAGLVELGKTYLRIVLIFAPFLCVIIR